MYVYMLSCYIAPITLRRVVTNKQTSRVQSVLRWLARPRQNAANVWQRHSGSWSQPREKGSCAIKCSIKKTSYLLQRRVKLIRTTSVIASLTTNYVAAPVWLGATREAWMMYTTLSMCWTTMRSENLSTNASHVKYERNAWAQARTVRTLFNVI